ncbi:MAG: DUF4349 domain-containing protein, partial [Arenimonas sp.]
MQIVPQTHQGIAIHRATRRRAALVALFALAVALLGAACSSKDQAAEPAMAGAPAPTSDESRAVSSGGGDDELGRANRNGSQLAYEHDVHVRLEAGRIAGNLAHVREACAAQKLGQCDVLAEELGAGEVPTGLLSLRAAPAAIGGLVKLAADGGSVAQRSTHAEDLADAVADNGLRRKRLELQHAKLSEIVERRDIKVDELIGLTERLAQIEAELHSAEQENSQQQRRIQTNLLTIHFEAVGVSAESSRIGESLRGLSSV